MVVCISSSILSVGVSMEATYVSCEVKRVLAIVILPQLRMIDFILSWISVKLWLSFSNLLSISKPRMVNVSVHDIPNSGHNISFGSSFSPMGMIWVLSRLHARPDIL